MLLPRRRRLVVALALVGGVFSAVGVPAQADPVGVASQPGQPRSGPGSDGRCSQTQRSFANPKYPSEQVFVYAPSGPAPAVTGGRCDGGARPVVLLAHGTGESDQASFAGLVHHLVSNGNVVVYPTHTMENSDKPSNYAAYYAMRDGLVAALASTPRADPSRIGVWGHSFGAGAVPYLVQQIAARGWGRSALWMSIVAQADSQLVTRPGTRRITVPSWTRSMTVSMEHDQMADNRLGIDVFESLSLPYPQKVYVRINSDPHGQPPVLAEHTAPGGNDSSTLNAIDFALWRWTDALEGCALSGRFCDADLASMGTWSDGTPVTPALVAQHPVDSGPYPATLAECDAGYGPVLNDDRIAYCGATHL